LEHPAGVVPPGMQEAAALAGRSDVAVVVVRDYRSEHADRPSITLSNEQDLLVQAVAAANPRTIVVVASGGPVSMPGSTRFRRYWRAGMADRREAMPWLTSSSAASPHRASCRHLPAQRSRHTDLFTRAVFQDSKRRPLQ